MYWLFRCERNQPFTVELINGTIIMRYWLYMQSIDHSKENKRNYCKLDKSHMKIQRSGALLEIYKKGGSKLLQGSSRGLKVAQNVFLFNNLNNVSLVQLHLWTFWHIFLLIARVLNAIDFIPTVVGMKNTFFLTQGIHGGVQDDKVFGKRFLQT